MTKGFLSFAAVLILATVGLAAPAAAQAPAPAPPPGAPPAGTPPPGKPKPKPAAGPAIAGKWSGQLNQVGSDKPIKIEVSISAKGADTRYPELECTGKLVRSGSSKSYVFFVEIIAAGRADKGGRCPDGAVILARQGDNLAMSWFGTVPDNLIVAYGTLSKQP